MKGCRVVFVGTPDFALPALSGLLEAAYKVAGVITQPDKPGGRDLRTLPSPVKRFALERRLRVYQPTSLKSPDILEEISDLSPDVIVVVAYGKILPQEVLAIPVRGCINVHPSLLPKHRGPSPIASAILAGDEVAGVSIMLMDAGMDSGPILAQASHPISPIDTTGSLTGVLAEKGAALLLETLPKWLAGEVQPRPQDEETASFSKLIVKGDGEINWRLSAEEIWRQVRTYNPWPVSSTIWKGRSLRILEATPILSSGELKVGEVIRLPIVGEGERHRPKEMSAGVGTGKGILGLLRVQLEGRRAMFANEFIQGHRDFIGSVLPS
ncbi:MAG: methionyl-tRNA formyltransferase [Dehalococcoidia bacterium]